MKHEELVDEVIENLESVCDPMASYHPSKEEYLRDVAQTLITLILSAVRDGLEIPGEVGRGKMELFVGEMQSCWAGFLLTEKPIANQAPTFIALRGTGKEGG